MDDERGDSTEEVEVMEGGREECDNGGVKLEIDSGDEVKHKLIPVTAPNADWWSTFFHSQTVNL